MGEYTITLQKNSTNVREQVTALRKRKDINPLIVVGQGDLAEHTLAIDNTLDKALLFHNGSYCMLYLSRADALILKLKYGDDVMYATPLPDFLQAITPLIELDEDVVVEVPWRTANGCITVNCIYTLWVLNVKRRHS